MQHENIWAPWRMAYITQLGNCDADPAATVPSCFLCDAVATSPGSDDARHRLVLRNDGQGTILLNRYPYTNGHLLVAPRDHLGDLLDLSHSARTDLIELTAIAKQLLDAALNPQGVNIGINLGRCAGAGLPGHIHVHVVPRWSGDTNFMQTVGSVRVIPQALEASYTHLLATLDQISHK